MKRGVAIAGLINAVSEEEELSVEPIDDALLCATLLYWDKVDIPDNDFVSVVLPRKFSVLEKEGVLTRTMVQYRSPISVSMRAGDRATIGNNCVNGRRLDTVAAINNAPAIAFEKLVQDKSTLWSYVQNSKTVSGSKISRDHQRAILVELHDALPQPPEDTPFEKILEFKRKRNDELSSLRCELDTIYQEIIGSPDPEHAKSLGVNRLKNNLNDLIRVSEEAWSTKLVKSFKFQLNPVTAAGSALAVAAPEPVSLAIGTTLALGSVLSFDFSDTVFNPKLPERLVPYRYVIDAKTELAAI